MTGSSPTGRVDARRLLCPMPVIRTQAAAEGLVKGSEIEILATDPGVLHDIPAWCRVHGHEVVHTERSGREIRLIIRIGSS